MNIIKKRKSNCLGLTLIELIVTLFIVSGLLFVALMSISGTLPRYKLSRGISQIYNAMLMAKSKSVSLNKDYRLNVIDTKNFKLQWDNEGTWTDDGSVQTLPSDVEVSQSPFDYVVNCGTNLIFTSRGMFTVLNGAQTAPFIELKNTKTNEEKGITINIGGNISIN